MNINVKYTKDRVSIVFAHDMIELLQLTNEQADKLLFGLRNANHKFEYKPFAFTFKGKRHVLTYEQWNILMDALNEWYDSIADPFFDELEQELAGLS